MEYDNQIVKWIISNKTKRWLLFLPLAFLSAIITSLIHQFLFAIAFDVESTQQGIWYYLVFIPTNALFTGASLLYVATFIAPIKNVSIVIITSIVIFFIIGEVLSFTTTEEFNLGLLEYGLFYCLGALLGRHIAISGKNNKL